MNLPGGSAPVDGDFRYRQEVSPHQLREVLEAEIAATPSLPEHIPPAGAEVVYAISRMNELLAITERHGVTVERVVLRCSATLTQCLATIDDVRGIPVTVVTETADFVTPMTEAGSFLAFLNTWEPGLSGSLVAVGITFPGPVTAEHLTTRWVLQTIDRVEPVVAEGIASRLSK